MLVVGLVGELAAARADHGGHGGRDDRDPPASAHPVALGGLRRAGDGRRTDLADWLPARHARLGLEVVERVETDDREAERRDDERERGAGRIHDLALDQRHDRAAHDRHHQSGRAELRRRPKALERDTVDRREHQRQAERQRDDGDHAGHVRTRHRKQAQRNGQEREHREHFGRPDEPDHPGHEKARGEEDQRDSPAGMRLP